MEIKRDSYLQQLIDRKENGMIKIITGIRRCGKSYLLFNLFRNHLLEEGVSEDQIIELALDDDMNIEYRNPNKLSEYVRSRITDSHKTYYIFIDEIQYAISKSERQSFVKEIRSSSKSSSKEIASGKTQKNLPDEEYKTPVRIYDVLNGFLHIRNADVYVTGSNSRFLIRDVLTEFRGRGDEVRVSPLSFKEFYSVYDGDFDDAWQDYVTFGGLPAVAFMKNERQKSEYLKKMFNVVYLNDVIESNGIRNKNELDMLVSVLASSIGSLTNPTKISDTFASEMKITYSSKTVSEHLEFLEEAYLISKAQRFDIKGRKYIGINHKYYFTDVGIRNACMNFRQQENTHLMENVIYNELRARGFNVDVGIVEINEKNENDKSVRRQLEIDFVINMCDRRYYIQSAYNIQTDGKRKQECRPFRNVNDSFKKIIIEYGSFRPQRDENGYLTISLKDFLLKEDILDA